MFEKMKNDKYRDIEHLKIFLTHIPEKFATISSDEQTVATFQNHIVRKWVLLKKKGALRHCLMII